MAPQAVHHLSTVDVLFSLKLLLPQLRLYSFHSQFAYMFVKELWIFVKPLCGFEIPNTFIWLLHSRGRFSPS